MNKKKLIKEAFKTSIFMFYGMILLFLFTYIFIGQHLGSRDFSKDLFLTPIYHSVANYDSLNDEEVIKIANFCEGFGVDSIDCVVKQLQDYYHYGDRNESDFKTLTEMKNETSLCRDIVIAQAAIFKRLGLYVVFRFLPTHVYLTTYGDGFYCNIDALSHDCFQ